MFRRVDLPAKVSGKLLLHSLPGRYEAIDKTWRQLSSEAVELIVCLAERHEIERKSFDYAQALEAGTVPCAVLPFEVPEGGVPENRDAFWALAVELARRLQVGETVLIHCVGGVGRTAMLAIGVLLALGLPASEARSTISQAGSTLETLPQSALVSWCASRMNLESPR